MRLFDITKEGDADGYRIRSTKRPQPATATTLVPSSLVPSHLINNLMLNGRNNCERTSYSAHTEPLRSRTASLEFPYCLEVPDIMEDENSRSITRASLRKRPVREGSEDPTMNQSSNKKLKKNNHRDVVDGICGRCRELHMARVVDKNLDAVLRHKNITRVNTEDASILLQRILFDTDIPFLDACTTCQILKKASDCRFTFATPPGGDTSTHGDANFDGTAGLLTLSRNLGIEHTSSTSSKSPSKYASIIIGGGAPRGYYVGDKFGLASSLPNLDAEAYSCRQVMRDSPDYDLLRGWISHCRSSHSDCGHHFSYVVRTIRLIDVQSYEIVAYPSESTVEYAALSYVWGPVPARSFKLGRLPEDIPNTIADAVTVTKKIGLQYLWCDYVCIDQEDLDSKMSQINIMDRIYSGAVLTIISLTGTSANEGLPRVGKTAPIIPQVTVDLGRGNRLFSMMPPFDRQLDHSTWVRRGWTFQEGLLSARRLIFTNHQVYFSCGIMECAESTLEFKEIDRDDRRDKNELSLPLSGIPTDLDLYGKKDILESIVGRYVKRELTYDGDTLKAIAGLFSMLTQSHFPDSFHFGIPMSDFRRYILWIQEDREALRLRLDNRSIERRECFPSWSWAGWKWTVPVSWNFHEYTSFEEDYPFVQIPQPPLLLGHGFRYLVNSPEDSIRQETAKWDNKVLTSLVSDIENMFPDLETIDDKGFAGLSNKMEAGLSVNGILIDLEFVYRKRNRSGGYGRSSDAMVRRDLDQQFCLSEEWKSKMDSPDIEFEFRIDGSVQRLITENKPAILSCLLVNIAISEGHGSRYYGALDQGGSINDAEFEVIIDTLLLEWVGGIAYRAGVVTLRISHKDIFKLQKADMKNAKFALE